MKLIVAFVVFAAGVLGARADFVIQQKVVSADQNGIVTMKYHGDTLRTDMPTERAGDVSVIRDLETGDSITMVHQRKVARKESGAEYRQRLAQMNSAITNAVPPRLVDTGRTEKVGDYDTEIYTWTNSRGMSWTLWVARNYPDYSNIRAMYQKLEQSPVGQLSKNSSPDIGALPGMAVKTKIEAPTGEISIRTLISAKEEPVADSDFQIPADYQLVSPGPEPGQSGPPPNH